MKNFIGLLIRRFILLLIIAIVIAFINVIIYTVLDRVGIKYPFFKTLYRLFDSTIYFSDKVLFKTGYKLDSHTGIPTDSLFSVLFLVLSILFLLMISVIWTLLQKTDNIIKSNIKLNNSYAIVRELVRPVLSIIMFHFGFIKLFLLQMPSNSIDQLLTPFGFFNRFELMWAFIGASKSFQMFLGISECIAASLLLFRKTTLLGLLICFTISLNICVMNFSYEVPARMLACLVMAMILFLLLPYTKSLFTFFFQGKLAQASPLHNHYQYPWANGLFKKILLFTTFIILGIDGYISFSKSYNRKRNQEYHIYQMQTLNSKNEIYDHSSNSIYSWNLLIFKPNKILTIIHKGGNKSRFKYDIDSTKNMLTLFRYSYFNDNTPLQSYKISTLSNKSILLNSERECSSLTLTNIPLSAFDFEINSTKPWSEKLPVFTTK